MLNIFRKSLNFKDIKNKSEDKRKQFKEGILHSFTGKWFVRNPDRGQALDDDQILVLGGEYAIESSGRIEGKLCARRKAGANLKIELSGRSYLRENQLIAEYKSGETEVFEISSEGLLVRIGTTLDAVEDVLVCDLMRRLGSVNVAQSSRPFMNKLDDKNFLVCIGANKAGTSWLYKFLDCHPEIYMFPVKEIHYFDCVCPPYIDFFSKKLHDIAINTPNILDVSGDGFQHLCILRAITGSTTSDDCYKELFERGISENQKAFGEITPSYSMLDAEGFSRLRSVHPDLRIVFIMRDPIDRFWSQLRFRNEVNELHENLCSADYHFRSNYQRCIENLEAVIPPENILYLFFEELFRKETIDRLCEFAGLEKRSDLAKPEHRYNEGLPAYLSEENRALIYQCLAEQYDFVAKKFADDMPEYWMRNMELYSGIEGSRKAAPARLTSYAEFEKNRILYSDNITESIHQTSTAFLRKIEASDATTEDIAKFLKSVIEVQPDIPTVHEALQTLSK